MSVSTKKRVAYGLAGVFGTGLLAWPFMSFGAIFAFDNPDSRLLAYYVAFSIWLYPAFWITGFLLSRASAERDDSLGVVLLKGAIPLLSAMLYLAVPVMGSIVWDFATQEQLNRRFLHAPEIYDLGNDRFAVQNYQGWFTTHRNFNLQNPEPFSAWIVDLSQASEDNLCLLSESNLDPDFFRANQKEELLLVQQLQPGAIQNPVTYTFEFGAPSIELNRPEATYVLKLQQK